MIKLEEIVKNYKHCLTNTTKPPNGNENISDWDSVPVVEYINTKEKDTTEKGLKRHFDRDNFLENERHRVC